MKKISITLFLLLAAAGAHAATPAAAAPKTDALAMLALGVVMALLSTGRRRRPQLFR